MYYQLALQMCQLAETRSLSRRYIAIGYTDSNIIGNWRRFSLLLPLHYLCLSFISFGPGFPIGRSMLHILFELRTIFLKKACYLLAVFTKLCLPFWIHWICLRFWIHWIFLFGSGIPFPCWGRHSLSLSPINYFTSSLFGPPFASLTAVPFQ